MMSRVEQDKFCMVFSQVDPASRRMFTATQRMLVSNPDYHDNILVCNVAGELFEADPAQLVGARGYVFMSRHSGRRPCITVHSAGNPLQYAPMGGEPSTLARSSASASHVALAELARPSSPLPVVMEATHHGPTNISRPVMFVEIGTGPEQWDNMDVVDYVVRAVLNSFKHEPSSFVPAVCFGGPHYSEKFTRLALLEGYGVGHIFSKYSVDDSNISLLCDSVDTVEPKARIALIDRKGLDSAKRRVIIDGLMRRDVETLLV